MEPDSLKADLAFLIEGSVSDDPSLLQALSTDYGGTVCKTARLVVQPKNAAEVAKVLAFAQAQNVPVSTRASGFSFAGQSLCEDGIVLDMRDLRGVLAVDPEGGSFEALAGTTWKEVVQATTKVSCIPPVLTSFLGTSVGGTLSAAGFGMSSAFHGTQVDQCLELEVALPSGELVLCSEEQNRDLFEHVLCGYGQFGVITRAKQRLRKTAPRIRTYFLQYDDLNAHLADQTRLVEEKRFTYLDAMLRTCNHGTRVFKGRRIPFHSHLYPMNLTVEVDENGEVDDNAVLAGLGFSRWLYAEDLSFAEYLLLGYRDEDPNPSVAKIFVDVLVPWSAVENFLLKVQAHLFPLIPHIEHTLLWPMTRSTLTRPLLKTPAEAMFMGIGLYSRVAQGPGVASTMAASKSFIDLAVLMGGTYYLSGAYRPDAAALAKHFGNDWPSVKAAKRRFDPQGLLNPGFFAWDDEAPSAG